MSTFDETLNKQIEALHEMVKDTPEYQQKQAIDLIVKSFSEIGEILQPIVENIIEAITDLWEEIVRIIKQVIDNVADFYWNIQRHYLFYDVKRKYSFFPDKLLTWTIRLIPDKWLMRARGMI